MKHVLVIHNLNSLQRRTTIEFASSFGKYAPPNTRVVHHNLRRPLDREIDSQDFDAVFLTYDLLSLRSSPQWSWAIETLAPLCARGRSVVAFPQDDYTANQILEQGLADLGTDIIYTPIETGLDLLYPTMSKTAELKHAYTGYVDEVTAQARQSGQIPLGQRTIDVGQRVRMLPPWFGSAGQEKGLFAERFASRAAATRLSVDISTREEDVFRSSGWYTFLGSCRATIGQKGGASLCDPTGDIMRAVVDYTSGHPDASFAEVEAACFPGLDNQVVMKAISPRLFDAAMLGTAQILIEDDYLGELEPWIHYIPTDSQVSNMEEINQALGDLKLLERLTESAAQALIWSGKYTYRSFVDKVFKESVPDSGLPSPPALPPSLAEQLQWRLSAALFEGVQRISYLAWATDATSEAAALVDDIHAWLSEDPTLVEHLDSRLLEAITDPVFASSTLDQIRPALVDIIVECFRVGASSLVADWLRDVGDRPASQWQLSAWIDQDRIALDEEALH